MCVIVVINAIIEVISLRSPLNEILLSLNVYESSVVSNYIEFRYGIKRCKSIFSIKTSFGGFGLIMFGFLSCMFYLGSYKKRIMQYLIWAMLLCAFISGTRAVVIGALILLLMFFSKTILRQMSKLQIFLGAIFILLFGGAYIQSVFSSILDTGAVVGSNSEIRQVQFDISLFYFLKSPIFGNGLSYSWDFVAAKFPNEALGLESVWFPIMIDRGFFGCISYLLIYIFGSFVSIKSGCRLLVFMYVAWLVANTLSSLPGLGLVFFMPIFILLHFVLKDKYGTFNNNSRL